MTGNTGEAVSVPHVAFAGVGALLLLALGHTISNLVRTLPAITTDVLAESFSVTPGDVAAMTGVFHLAFAVGQIPVGVALDRFGIKRVFMSLISTVVIGSLLAAVAQNSVGFVLSQAVLGLGCSGMLLCPLTYAAKNLSNVNFALWSALVLAVGNSGMLLSASPMALVIEALGWRSAFIVSAALAATVALTAWLGVRSQREDRHPAGSVSSEFRQVARIGSSRELRGVVILAFVSFAVVIGVRGMWAGPWLMEVKQMSRVEAGNIMLILTLMLISMPMLVSLVDRRTGRTGMLLVSGHLIAGMALLTLPFGRGLAPLYDLSLLVVFGVAISVQPLLFVLGRQSVGSSDAGKALAAVNLAFFAGAATIQALSAPVVGLTGFSGVIMFLGLLAIAGAMAFLLTARRPQQH
ncbi:putative MFS family arabinose efflux permease [Devosia subaequoris]|uniref:Putative MFS family arabinose efflux permease n=1 Tax=Devosia subaequoris TaxID=395930 RepID=A0A7W6INB6_9HYPH|nr:MFS transporter [Devosia subaequoris]MBB4052150.1 putative MFS family arabinose efflux permease [Devosia subaequoris]MCP1209315.1 MFS transporter [Devosia subaequoris]